MPADRTRGSDVVDLTASSKRSSSSSTAKKKKEKENRPAVVHAEIIEISSDEDEEPAPPPPRNRRKSPATATIVVAEMEKKLKKLEQDKKQLQTENSRLKEENANFKAMDQARKGMVHLNVDDIDEHIMCEICSLTMWSPYILSGCGHNFCGACLEGWFSRTHKDWLANNPQLRNVQVPAARHLMVYGVAPPQYICPKCRSPVRDKPTQDFSLKGLVAMIAKVKGDKNPGQREVSFGRYFT